MQKYFLVLFLAILFGCGGDTSAQQVGVGNGNYIPLHQHSGINDGGSLNLPNFDYTTNGQTTLSALGSWQTVSFTQGIVASTWFTGNTTYTPQVAGTYLINYTGCGYSTTTCTKVMIGIFKNGTLYSSPDNPQTNTTGLSITQPNCVNYSRIIPMNGTTDYITFNAWINGTGTGKFSGLVNGVRVSN